MIIGIGFFPFIGIGIGFKQTLPTCWNVYWYWKSINAQLFDLILVLEKNDLLTFGFYIDGQRLDF